MTGYAEQPVGRYRTNQPTIIREQPERDYGQLDRPDCGCPTQLPPPEPPMGDYNSWELQYCKWWGWTWVKKGQNNNGPITYAIAEPAMQTRVMPMRKRRRKKNTGWCNCFGDNSSTPSREIYIPPRMIETQTSRVLLEERKEKPKKRTHSSDSEDSCCACCCRTCQSCCCAPPSCCCCNRHHQKHQQGCLNTSVQTCDACPCFNHSTQTSTEVKEQATKISERHIPEDRKGHCKHRKRCCNCKKRTSCCRRQHYQSCCNVNQSCCCTNYCPPPQTCCNACNSCNIQKVEPPKPEVTCVCTETKRECPCPVRTKEEALQCTCSESPGRLSLDPLINFCLNYQPDYTKYKMPDFSMLHKPLDLLLKNNMNIMKLFENRTFQRDEDRQKHYKFLDATETISYFSRGSGTHQEQAKTNDPEHHKLLTAVCEAILSNHKMDDETNQSNALADVLKMTSSYSTCNTNTSQRSITNRLEHIFKTKLDSCTQANLIQSEIGVQVTHATTKRTESSVQTNKRFKSPDKPLLPSNFPRAIDLLRKRSSTYTRASKRISVETTEDESKKIRIINQPKVSPRKSRIPIKIEPGRYKIDSRLARRMERSPKASDEEELLTTLDLTDQFTIPQSYVRNNKNSLLSRYKETLNVLDSMSPPFSDTDDGKKLN